jgi:competence protein ComEC
MTLSPAASDRVLAFCVLSLAIGARHSDHGVPRTAVLVSAFASMITAVIFGRTAAAITLSLLAAAACGSVLAGRSVAGLRIEQAGSFEGAAMTVVADPVAGRYGTQSVVRWKGKHIAVRETDRSGALSRVTVGDRLRADLSVRASPDLAGWRRAKHLAGQGDVAEVTVTHRAGGLWGIANGVRRHLQRGFTVLPADLRPLASGFVLGDDRGQRPEIADDFRASGLGHLLVVSGQNVSFVLMTSRPLIERLRLSRRVLAVAVVLVLFGTVTRWEPSVLRAVAMAGAAAWTRSAGRPQPTLRVVGLGVGLVLVIDPLLVWSLGFLLSVGATLGLALFAEPLENWFESKGVPIWLRVPLAATLAAQVLTVWLVIPLSDGVSVSSVPANLAALPAAGPAMVVGIVMGILAGFVRPGVAEVLLLPMQVLLWWVASVARIGASWPLGRWGYGSMTVVVVAGVVALIGRSRARFMSRAAVVVICAVFVSGVVGSVRPPSVNGARLRGGATLWRAAPQGSWPFGWGSEATVLVVGGLPDVERLAGSLRAQSVRRIDVLVLPRPSRSSQAVIPALRSRFGLRAVVSTVRVVDQARTGIASIALAPDDRLMVGSLVVALAPEVSVVSPGGAAAGVVAGSLQPP